MQRIYYNKVLSIALLGMLLLSLLPAVTLGQSSLTKPVLSATSGNVGTKITVSGNNTGGTPFGPLGIYWDGLLAENKIATGQFNATSGYKIEITIPEDVAGTHYIIVKDETTGASSFTAFKILPKITLSVTSGLPGDTVTVSGTGFAGSVNVTIRFQNATYDKDITPSVVPVTSSKGSFSASVTVPDVAYGNYNISAKDAKGNVVNATFAVKATITLSPTEGPSGTVVTVTGRGFTAEAGKAITVTINGSSVPVVASIKTTASGNFTGQFIIPTLAKGNYQINATDGKYWATASFKVTGTTAITLSPKAGKPATVVTIEGVNFTAIADTEVTILFGTIPVGVLKTNSTGGFKGTFKVPSLPTGVTYNVTATDAKGLKAKAQFLIALTLITLTPESGVAGSTVTVTGYGFLGNKANVTINNNLVVMNTNVGNLAPEKGVKFIVPTLSVGTYTVTVTDDKGLSASASYNVTATTQVAISPSSAPKNYKITITGKYFKPNSNVTIFFYNKTSTFWNKTVATGTEGNFTTTWTVWSNLTIGDYWFNFTDVYQFPTGKKLIKLLEVPFKIVLPTVVMSTRLAEYSPGDTVSFSIKSTFPADATITVKDPTGITTTITIKKADWVPIGDYYYVKYEAASFTLPSDAKTGTWTWSTNILEVPLSGSFLVVERTTLSALSQKISSLETSLANLSARVDALSSDLDALSASLSAQGVDINATKSAIAALKSDVASLASAIASVRSDVNSVSNAVSALKSDIAALQSTVASLQSTVNTLQSSLNALKTDVSNVGSVASEAKTAASSAESAAKNAATTVAGISGAVYGAMVLALIAALAAIVAVIQLQRKVAG